MSVRGTITSLTRVSPSSNTEWIIFDSRASITSFASAMSTRSRSSASEANGPSENPRPGVSAFPSRIISCATGPSTVVSSETRGAKDLMIRSGCCLPIVLGATPHSMKNTTSRIATSVTSRGAVPSMFWKTTRATSAMAVASKDIRVNITALMEGAGSWAINRIRSAPRVPDSTSFSARPRENPVRAVSTATSRDARIAQTSATVSSIHWDWNMWR